MENITLKFFSNQTPSSGSDSIGKPLSSRIVFNLELIVLIVIVIVIVVIIIVINLQFIVFGRLEVNIQDTSTNQYHHLSFITKVLDKKQTLSSKDYVIAYFKCEIPMCLSAVIFPCGTVALQLHF